MPILSFSFEVSKNQIIYSMKKIINSGNFVEKISLIPRSIIRTFQRFRLQLLPGIEERVVKEFRISRYQFLVALKSLLFLLFFPIFFNVFGKQFLIRPTIEYFWNKEQTEIFLNDSQEKRAYFQIENFSEKLYFESLILPELKSDQLADQSEFFRHEMQEKIRLLAIQSNNESIDALTNFVTDMLMIINFWLISQFMKPQMIILKSFLIEFLYSFGDTTKSFLLIFFTDLFVGFHSSHGWEVLLEKLMNHFGFPENEDFVFLFVATFPVLLDTVIKYWIFRYLNRISPSTVATYHTMIE